MGPSVHYRFHTVEEGVTAALSRPDGGALSNSGIVDTGKGVLVFDTSLNLRAAADLVAAAVSETGRAPSMAANSHWHLDHTLGNQVFSSLPIFGTRETRRILIDREGELMAEAKPAALRKDIRKFGRLARQARTASDRRYLQSVVRLNRFLLSVAPEIRLTPPNRTFESRVVLPGSRKAELLCFGSGHTASDAILHLPREKIVFAGDLVVVGTHPNLTSGNPEHWLSVLAKIERLRPERIVPGHGPVSPPGVIRDVGDYLSSVLELAQGPEKPEIPARFRKWTEHGMFEENLKFLKERH